MQGPGEHLVMKGALEEPGSAGVSLAAVCDDRVLSWPELLLEYEGN